MERTVQRLAISQTCFYRRLTSRRYSENIDEDSDADLFVSQGPKSSLKRPYHMTMEDDDGEDNGGAEADDEDLSG